MPKCTILNQNGTPVKEFSTEDFPNEKSISVGLSKRCVVPLSDFAGQDKSVAKVHFALIRRGYKWWIVSSDEKYPVMISDKPVGEAEIFGGMTLKFGNFSAVFEKARIESGYSLMFDLGGGKFESAGLMKGDNTIGSSKANDINMDSDSVAMEHAVIIFNGEEVFTIEDHNSQGGIVVQGEMIGSVTEISPYEVFYLGKVRVIIVEDEDVAERMKKADPVTPHLSRWKKYAFFAGGAVLVLIAALLYQLTLGSSVTIVKKIVTAASREANDAPLKINASLSRLKATEGATQVENKSSRHAMHAENFKNREQDMNFSERIIAAITPDVIKGEPESALQKLDVLRRAENTVQQSKMLQRFNEALQTEKTAVSEMNFFRNRLAVNSLSSISQRYGNFLDFSNDTRSVMLANCAYWENAILELEGYYHELAKYPEFMQISYFVKDYPGTKNKIRILIQAFSFIVDIQEKWNQRDWKGLLKKINSQNSKDIIEQIGLQAEVDNMREAAEYRVEIVQRVADILEPGSIGSFDIVKYKDLEKEALARLQRLEHNPLFPHDAMARTLKILSGFAESMEKIRKSLLAWEKDELNASSAQHLISELGELNRYKSAVSNDYVTRLEAAIRKVMVKRLDRKLAALKVTADARTMRQINLLNRLYMFIDDDEAEHGLQKLREYSSYVYEKIADKCDKLFFRYSETLKVSKTKAVVILKQIIELSLPDTPYYSWSRCEYRRLQRCLNRQNTAQL
ncbi:FHA domain-containing protein [Lentisphaerota bacterium ZTH]|nr:FHA domain-containing protein [Lentisphaerota bacterium]WET05771.1 FHA domain-containing protein [Lentisphaerota bacterium ZTH]